VTTNRGGLRRTSDTLRALAGEVGAPPRVILTSKASVVDVDNFGEFCEKQADFLERYIEE